MIFEHEIPAKSKLYFGKSAKLKRKIEHLAASFLEEKGFEEILTPLFSYHQQEVFDDIKRLIRINDAQNHLVSLRADSTIDVVRIVTRRLSRSNANKKWFYIQPVFSYPTIEQYQVGAEIIDGSLEEVALLALKLLQKLDINATFQIANITIAKILEKNYGIAIDDIANIKIEKMLQSKYPWMENLIKVHNVNDLDNLSIYPQDIAKELEKMKKLSQKISYEKIIISPLYYTPMRYYDSLIFRIFEGEALFMTAGEYKIKDVSGAGFALYVDSVIEKMM